MAAVHAERYQNAPQGQGVRQQARRLALVPDPDGIAQRFKSEFEAMLYSVLLEEPAQDQPPASESLAKTEASRSASSAASKELAST